MFEGLYIHAQWTWSERYPVVRLDFGGGTFGERGDLAINVMDQLAAAERRAGIVFDCRSASGRLSHLPEELHTRHGQPVVVLVDEYDKPILDVLESPETARANRNYLRGLYGTIKSSDAHVRFSFLTGVSKFSNGQPVLRPQQSDRHHARPRTAT